MPAIYTHDRFGKDVYHRLPKELKKVVRKDKKLYLIGLQGPDIFFYYHPLSTNPIVSKAHQMHERNVDEFFRKCRGLYQKKQESGMIAYLLGFACHFLLDSTCHPYINGYSERSGVSHAVQEAELDRVFLLEDKKNPFTYDRSAGICPYHPGNRVIQRCFSNMALEDIVQSLKGMTFYTNLLNQQHALLRNGLILGMKAMGVETSISDQVLRKRPNPRSKPAVLNLLLLYEKALDEAPDLLVNLAKYLDQGTELSGRFQRKFS
ncbi:MAG TPA: zinc dependent phospholipase C family protein [Candidatus Pelethocola excrementipullorum]|nr:zinc dependent phospholipase C family protein [Candidatus Pelethocola excrementipullorum]